MKTPELQDLIDEMVYEVQDQFIIFCWVVFAWAMSIMESVFRGYFRRRGI